MNIFKNAKFGDKFRTRDGRMVLFSSPAIFYKGWYWIVVQDYGTCRYFEDGLLNIGEENPLDIVGKWEDEEKLDRLAALLADKYCKERNAGHINPNDWEIANDCIKIGYNEALDRVCEWLKANSYSFRSDEYLWPLIKAMKGE